MENEIPIGSAQFSDKERLTIPADRTKNIDDSFEAIQQIDNEVQILILKNNDFLQECDEAKATGKFPFSQKDLREVIKFID